MSNATFGAGGVFAWNSHTIGEVDTIGGVNVKADTVEATTHQSANNFKEYILGLLDTDEITIEGNFYAGDTDGQIAFLTDLYARTGRTATITFPTVTGTAWTITALPTGFSTQPPINDKIRFTLSIKPTGKPTMSVAASNNLSDLTLTTATLYPSFAAATYDYTATSTGSSVTVTPTASAGTITVNGNTVATGEASAAISLGSSGDMTTITIVVTETSKAPKTYTVRVAKTA
ncbi:cadherin-like beta sandwich domain-containing protein [Papillibacter cinnamivorans]|uniref:Cadherin-like beta sandwich domain-containing protein n=1 Tax=Papillibacter cinnamivorans DSM 12816 TaxID=1122930 RepID=A0A1W1YR60_9FIRM|nr:phage tail tube protein [Papillibacter cinnamivorans]SMC38602.1 Cadherin-like beta sandwich domain-containing protein [Papillibacter cinnamivorans DSM 12816]